MKVVTAQKEHECSLCGKKIPVGSRYWSDYKEFADGCATNVKQHTNCAEYESSVTAQESGK